MLSQQRYDYIVEQIKKNGSVTVTDVAAALSVSIETVRRDLIMLETHGKLKRVFGGAVAIDRTKHFTSFETRLDKNTELKAELSQYAISFIDNGDTVFLESGSTATEMAKVLMKYDLDIIIITHSNTVFNILKSKYRVVLIGGEYIKEDDCFGGNLTVEFLKNFHVNKAFVFPSALSAQHGIESFLIQTMSIEKLIPTISDKVFVLADSEKFGARAMFKVMDLDPEFIYVTDSRISKEAAEEFAENGLVLISGAQ